MAETLATIRARVQRYVGTAVNSTINDAIKDAHKELQRKYNYSQMEYTKLIDVADGDTTFDLPVDFKAVVNPEISDSDVAGYTRMKGILKNGIMSRAVTDSGKPMGFRIWSGVGYLYPAAAGSFSFNLEYYRWLPEPGDVVYSDDDQAQAFLDMAHVYFRQMAIAEGFRRLGKSARADEWERKAERTRISLENDDLENSLAGVDLQMQLPG